MNIQEVTAIIRAENLTLRVGDDEQGYTELSAIEYEAQIAEWAQGRLTKITKAIDALAKVESKINAFDKLTVLGFDPKAFDLDIENLSADKISATAKLAALGLTADDLKALGL